MEIKRLCPMTDYKISTMRIFIKTTMLKSKNRLGAANTEAAVQNAT